MRRLSDSFRSFKEGLQPKLLWEYWLAFKNTFWDLFWGATVIGIPFGIYTLIYAPSKMLLLSYVLAVVFMAGYVLWKADQVRLMTKFKITDIKVVETPTNQINLNQVYVQVVPRCLSETPIRECKGHLLRVYIKYTHDEDKWEGPIFDEPVDLGWSIYGSASRTLEPNISQRLNVCFWNVSPGSFRIIIPATEPIPSRLLSALNSSGIFRFEIRVTAADCSAVNISVDVTLDGCELNKPIVSLMQGFTEDLDRGGDSLSTI